MLILVQVKSEGDVLHVEQETMGVLWASALLRCRPAATEHLLPQEQQTMQKDTESLPVLFTEEYNTKTDWEEEGGKENRDLLSLVSCVLLLTFMSTAVSALEFFSKRRLS